MIWNTNPELFTLGMFHIHWYGLFFATAFVIGYSIIRKIFILENTPLERVDSLLWYTMAGTFIGARLGHCIFYEPQIYLADPIRILKIWEGGLASHGAAIGLITAYLLYARKYKEYTFREVFDRMFIPISISGFMIRMGNFFNSEIIGKPSDMPWAVVFQRVDSVPRHPAQLYEALAYLTLFFVLSYLFWKTETKRYTGRLFGISLVGIFGARFLLEFVKENQVQFESNLPMNLGQLLSLPLIAFGVFLIVRAKPTDKPQTQPKRKKKK